MRAFVVAAGMAAIVLGVSGCSSSYGASSPTGPGNSTPRPADAITIDIIGIDGAQSFSPNPATVPGDRTVVWHNTDSVTHHVVFNDGELDTGAIAPGGFSAPMSFAAPGPYHCSIHPEMVGTIVGN